MIYRGHYLNGYHGFILFVIFLLMLNFLSVIIAIVIIIGLASFVLWMYDFIRDEFDQQNREVAQARNRPSGPMTGATLAPKRRHD